MESGYKNTLSKTVSFKHPRLCLKFHKYRIKNHFGDVLTNIFYHGDVLTNFWGRFDQFGDVLTRGRFDLGTFFIKTCHPTGVKTSTHLDNGHRNHSRETDIQSLSNT